MKKNQLLKDVNIYLILFTAFLNSILAFYYYIPKLNGTILSKDNNIILFILTIALTYFIFFGVFYLIKVFVQKILEKFITA